MLMSWKAMKNSGIIVKVLENSGTFLYNVKEKTISKDKQKEKDSWKCYRLRKN